MNIDALTTQCHQLTTMRVFVPKRRKPVLIKDVAHRLQAIIFELVAEHGWKLIALELQPDHVHFFINAPTHESPADIARWVKGRASHHLRKEFPELKKLPALWTPTYASGNNRSSQYGGSQKVY